MADRLSIRAADSDREELGDSLEAMRTIVLLSRLFLAILLLTLLVPPVIFLCAKFDIISVISEQPADERLETFRQQLGTLISACGLVARLSASVLLAIYFLSCNFALSARLGGVHHHIVGWLWMVLVVVWLLPWSMWGFELPQLFFGVDELVSELQSSSTVTQTVARQYIRFVGLACITLLGVLVADRRVGMGYHKAVLRVQSRLQTV